MHRTPSWAWATTGASGAAAAAVAATGSHWPRTMGRRRRRLWYRVGGWRGARTLGGSALVRCVAIL